MTSVWWIDQTPIPLIVFRQDRRSITMRFVALDLVLKAPHHVSEALIEAFLHRKKAWILKAHQQALHLQSLQNTFHVLNQKWNLMFHEGKELHFYFEDEDCHIVKPKRLSQQQALAKIKAHTAQTLILPIMKNACVKAQLEPKLVQLKVLKSSWGRCSSKGVITLSQRLIECDPKFIEYVCLHELAHLKHLNHSKAFWATLKSWMPEYQQVLKLTPYHLVK